MVYVKHLERIERAVLSDRQCAAILLAAGQKGVEMPTLEQARADFDAALLEEPKVVDPSMSLLRRELGLAS